MIFGNKKEKCRGCNSKVSKDYDFCPYCGNELGSGEDMGMLGRNDTGSVNNEFLGMTDKLMGSLVNSLMKKLDKQFQDINKVGNVKTFPNGVRIRVGPGHVHRKKPIKRGVTREQIEKMKKLPRGEADANVRRLSDKVVYELKTQGVDSPEDIFVSKLEKGYEVKAIGSKKIYVNSLPVDLPLRGFVLGKDKLMIEFKTGKV